MSFPTQRLRRLRSSREIRRLVRETSLSVDDFLYPVFIAPGRGLAKAVTAMPGVYNFSLDKLLEELKEVVKLGIPGVLLFGIPTIKDALGSEAYHPDGVIQQGIRGIKDAFPQLLVFTDVCLCEYTSHGHCGVVEDGRVLNDPTLELLAQTAVSHVAAGADIVAPSDMMDGRVGAIRRALDVTGYDQIPIMAYSAKYSSSFYGPFREAAGSAPQFGDRKTYQMDPANGMEALREVWLDIEEGADIIMVKPALAYLDVIRMVKEETGYPLATYNVSGEYSMVKAAAQMGWLNERDTVLEICTGIKRAGADIIISYHAKDVARWLEAER